MKYFFVFGLFICVSSCVTTKWKHNYTNNKIANIFRKYSVPSDDFTFVSSGSQFVNKPYKDFTRRDVKKDIVYFERSFALTPDSLSQRVNSSDSFYTNKNKIKYIIKHKLQTNYIHLLPNSQNH